MIQCSYTDEDKCQWNKVILVPAKLPEHAQNWMSYTLSWHNAKRYDAIGLVSYPTSKELRVTHGDIYHNYQVKIHVVSDQEWNHSLFICIRVILTKSWNGLHDTQQYHKFFFVFFNKSCLFLTFYPRYKQNSSTHGFCYLKA